MGFYSGLFFTIFIIGTIIYGIYLIDQDEKNEALKINTYMQDPKLIKEMESLIGTSGEISGAYLFIAGGVYGSIDTQHIMTLVYGTNINGENLHRTISIPFDQVDIITIESDKKPYFIITKVREWDFDTKDYIGKIERIKLFLPEGWEILNKR